eukprot:551274-Prymnesium_polylepis.1
MYPGIEWGANVSVSWEAGWKGRVCTSRGAAAVEMWLIYGTAPPLQNAKRRTAVLHSSQRSDPPISRHPSSASQDETHILRRPRG